jgi:hypothetical protein
MPLNLNCHKISTFFCFSIIIHIGIIPSANERDLSPTIIISITQTINISSLPNVFFLSSLNARTLPLTFIMDGEEFGVNAHQRKLRNIIPVREVVADNLSSIQETE